jgi:hypothetical protein
MARNKIQRETSMEIEGQLTLWDIEITKKPAPFTITEEEVTKTDDLFTKKAVLDTKILNRDNVIRIDKDINQGKLSIEQQQFLDKNNIMQNENLSRIIRYCGGGLGIELKEGQEYKTIYINQLGKEEFTYNKKSSVIPMDRILFYKESLTTNEIQEDKLKEIKKTLEIKKIIRRKGDENILIVTAGKVISIIPKGWVLEFYGVQAIHDEDEVEREDFSQDIEEIRAKIKVGDTVEAKHGNKIITGRICHVYGPGNISLNILFDNETKHTAICRVNIINLIKIA